MIDQVKKAIQQIEKLPREKQVEIAQLIQDELNWDDTFDKTRDKLEILAKEAIQDYCKIASALGELNFAFLCLPDRCSQY